MEAEATKTNISKGKTVRYILAWILRKDKIEDCYEQAIMKYIISFPANQQTFVSLISNLAIILKQY